MPQPYVVRFVSLESGVGKTNVATRVVKELRTRGYRISVIKHCSSGIELEEKDSKRYVESGAEVVVASSPGLLVTYVTNYSDMLENALTLIKTPIVIVEGFKTADIGDAVLVVRGEEDLKKLSEKVVNVIAVISHIDVTLPRNVTLVKIGEEVKLADLLETRILEFFYQQTPRVDCKVCGFSSCRDLVSFYLKGRAEWCPVASRVEVIVDGSSVALNPFVKNIIKLTIKGMLRSLKGVPLSYKRVDISISD